MSIPESDWRRFKALKEKALDRLCESILQSSISVATNESQSAHERYLSLYDLIMDKNQEMARTFDGHSRSRATMQLCQMAALNLVTEEEVGQFSEETQAVIKNFIRATGA